MNLDILQLQDGLRSLRAIQSVLEENVQWKRHKKLYASDRLRPQSYSEDIRVKSVNVKISRVAIVDAETILNKHAQLKKANLNGQDDGERHCTSSQQTVAL